MKLSTKFTSKLKWFEYNMYEQIMHFKLPSVNGYYIKEIYKVS